MAMEALHLLLFAASTLVRSSLLSLLLAVRSFLRLAPSERETTPAARLYEGRVRHVRRRPVPHEFEYPVRYAVFDLDRGPQPARLSAPRAREVAATNGPVLLLTIPASVGYEQNPLSVYYCYDVEREGEAAASSPQLKMCIAEVTNTPWGEKVFFVFSPGADVVAKPLHVSPFMDMLGNWRLHANEPGEDLYLAITVQHPTLGDYFTATLRARRLDSSSNPVSLEMFFWLMPHKVAIWIYWQALLLWRKGVAVQDHPRYLNSAYREDALKRDQLLHCSIKDGQCKASHPDQITDGDNRSRWCIWKDAEWPWS